MSHPVSFTLARDPLPDHEQKQAALELSQRGLGGSAARWRRRRLPGAGQPVRRIRRTGRHLRRRRGGEIRRRPRRARPQRRILDRADEAVDAHPARSSPGLRRRLRFWPQRLRLQRLQKPHRLAGRGRRQFALPHHAAAAHESADRPARDARRHHRASSRRARPPICR